MKFPPLYNGRILSRYKRFLADIELEGGEVITAHCPNTGAMTGCWAPGAPAQVSASDNPKRKLKWTLERIDMGAGWIGVNTARVNHVVRSFLEQDAIPSLEQYSKIKPEPVFNAPGFDRSRFDFLLQHEGKTDCYVEVKNTTLLTDKEVQFPDAKTTRGRKHLLLLQYAVELGHRGVILFAVNRPEGSRFSVAKHIDPDYYETLCGVRSAGVEVIAVRICHTSDGVKCGETLPIFLD